MSRAAHRIISAEKAPGEDRDKSRLASAGMKSKHPPVDRRTTLPAPVTKPPAAASGSKLATPSKSPAGSKPSTPRPPPLDLSPTPVPDPVHPFAHTTAKLELIPPSSALSSGGGSASGIDIEEEARLYEELCASWDGEVDGREIPPTPPSPTFSPSLFSRDITLSDNTGGVSAAFARDVRIAGWTQVGDLDASRSPSIKQGMGLGGGAYVVYDCVITTKEGTMMHILKRYSAFVALDAQLRRTLPRTLLPLLPTLPPKAPLARFRSAFLDRRRRHLQFWLASVLLHPEIGGMEVVRGWVCG